MKALGGSGYYLWSIENENIATISAGGLIRSNQVGTTKVTARDHLNQKNLATITVEVSPVHALTWLEDHLEIERNNQTQILNIIALDK